ncbi:hypothetical protein JI57_02455 [Psychromonas sp. PRT-SC03]|nr:hypothetical protein JI57_02455 [Psychromonas sp. PRT-SC03]
MNRYINLTKEYKEISLSGLDFNFTRNSQLELRIDKELAWQRKPCIYAFLENISEYSDLFCDQQETHLTWGNKSINDLIKIIDLCQINIINVHESFLPYELREHFLNIKDYVSKLHSKYVGPKVYLDDFLNEINHIISNSDFSVDGITKLFLSHPWINKRIEGLTDFEGNLTIRLNRGRVRIILMFNPESYKSNFFYDSYLFFANDSVDDNYIKDLIESDASIKGVFTNSEDKYLHYTTIINDSSRNLIQLECLIG